MHTRVWGVMHVEGRGQSWVLGCSSGGTHFSFFKCQGFSLVWNSQSRLGRQVSELGSPSAASLLGTGVLNVHIHSGPFNHGFWEWSPDLMLIQQALSRQNVFPRQKIFSLWKNEQKYQETLARFHDPLQMSETTSVTETHRRTDLVCFPS